MGKPAKRGIDSYEDFVVELELVLPKLEAQSTLRGSNFSKEKVSMFLEDLKLLVSLRRKATEEHLALNLDAFRVLDHVLKAFENNGLGKRPPLRADTVSKMKKLYLLWKDEQQRAVADKANEALALGKTNEHGIKEVNAALETFKKETNDKFMAMTRVAEATPEAEAKAEAKAAAEAEAEAEAEAKAAAAVEAEA